MSIEKFFDFIIDKIKEVASENLAGEEKKQMVIDAIKDRIKTFINSIDLPPPRFISRIIAGKIVDALVPKLVQKFYDLLKQDAVKL